MRAPENAATFVRVNRNSAWHGRHGASQWNSVWQAKRRKIEEMKNGRLSMALHDLMCSEVEICLAAASPASRPVTIAFKIPDPVNGSTNPIESPAG